MASSWVTPGACVFVARRNSRKHDPSSLFFFGRRSSRLAHACTGLNGGLRRGRDASRYRGVLARVYASGERDDDHGGGTVSQHFVIPWNSLARWYAVTSSESALEGSSGTIMAGAYSVSASSDPPVHPMPSSPSLYYIVMPFAFQICMRNTTAPIARRISRAYVSSASSAPNSTFACRWVDRSDDHFGSRDSFASPFPLSFFVLSFSLPSFSPS